MISSGARKDFMVMLFSYSLVFVSTDETMMDEMERDENIVVSGSDNKNYHKNKRVKRRLEALRDKLSDIASNVYKAGGSELQAWVRKNNDIKIGNALQEIKNKEINLELLAVYILFVNFCEMRNKLLPEFDYLTDHKMLLELAEMIVDAGMGKLEESLFLEAYNLIRIIKS